MANYTMTNLTTAVAGVSTTTAFRTQSTAVYTVEVSNGTLSIGDINLGSFVTETIPGWLTGRRPVQGQLFPRGVYNK